MNPVGRVRCKGGPIAKPYGGASQPFFIAQLAVLNVVGLSRASPLDISS